MQLKVLDNETQVNMGKVGQFNHADRIFVYQSNHTIKTTKSSAKQYLAIYFRVILQFC